MSNCNATATVSPIRPVLRSCGLLIMRCLYIRQIRRFAANHLQLQRFCLVLWAEEKPTNSVFMGFVVAGGGLEPPTFGL